MPLIDNKQLTLQDALKSALPEAESIDILTAYFYFSGFSALIDELKDKRIRILVGKSIDPDAIDDLSAAMKVNPNIDLAPYQNRNYPVLSRSKKREEYLESFIRLYNKSALSEAFDGTDDQRMQKVFEQKLKDGTLEIRMTSTDNHAKAYILTNKSEYSKRGERKGTVFMGSANFTYSGLIGQGELVNEFKSNVKYDEHRQVFDVLWNDSEAIDIQTKDSNNDFLEQIQKRLWIHATPDPYKIYVRILHELYSQAESEDVKSPDDISGGKFSNLKYQLDAIKNGIDCIRKNNGVIIADVVGLGKSIIACSIAHNLDIQRTVIIVPPHLTAQWEDYVQDFGIRGAIVESGGMIKSLHEKYAKSSHPTLFIIDEAHRYRNELTDDYQLLHQLTRSHTDNKVILLTATPYNNKPQDLFAMIKLFQTPSRSTINSVDNLGLRFHELIADYRKLEKYGKKNLTEDIRNKLQKLSTELRLLIEPVVIRRSRIDLKEIREYAEDLKNQRIEFPEVIGPELITYDLGNIRYLYTETLIKLTDPDGGFVGARYQPSKYIKDRKQFVNKYGKFFDESDLQTAQANLAQFMKRYLVQRFESSKYAFRTTLVTFIRSNELALKWLEKGYVPIQKQGVLMDPDENGGIDDIDSIMRKIEDGEDVDVDKIKKGAVPISRDLFEDSYAHAIAQDLMLLRQIYAAWFSGEDLGEDPKQKRIEEKITMLQKEDPKRKIVIFSSYADTAIWVAESLKSHGFPRTMLYTGQSTKSDKQVVSENFDASYKLQKDDYDIIVATDALSEGFNLHRAGAIINYDIPYNPTRVVQRIGRINRINKKVFDQIFIFNFFPTDIGEEVANVKGVSTLKMLLINNIVGSDTRTLTPDEDLKSYFKKRYDEIAQEGDEASWDNVYRNAYDAIKHDQVLLRDIMDIPERTRIVRDNRPRSVSISFAKRGNGVLFAVADEDDLVAEIIAPELVLGLFEADQSEKAIEGDAKLDKKFEILRERITAPHPVPKIEGRRADALKIVEFLKEKYGPERDYLFDLYDAIKTYDDLSDGELKFIAQLSIKENELKNAVETLKDKFPTHYIDVIKQKADAVDRVSEIIMFTEDLRK